MPVTRRNRKSEEEKPPKSEIDLDKIKELIKLMEDHELTAFELEDAGFKVRLEKGSSPEQVVAPIEAPDPASEKIIAEDTEQITSPMVGTFYKAPSPDSDAFVKVGDAIEIKGWPAKDGSKKLGGHQLALPSGEIFVLRRAPDQSPASPRFRSVHGFLGEFRRPSPKEALANTSNNQNNFSVDGFEVPNRNVGFGTREGGRRRGQRGNGNGFIRSFQLTASLDKDANGEISESEIEGAVAVLELLDKNNDGKLTREEIRPNRDQSPYTAPTSDTSKAQTPLPENKSSELEEAQAEFIEHMEEAGFAVSALKELLAEDRPTKEAQMTEIENLQVALFNSKVLVQLIPVTEDALKHHDGDVVKAREGIKQALLKTIDYTLTIEKYIIVENRKSAIEYLGELIKIQRQSHRIYQ